MSEVLVKVDRKGRIVIPAGIRRELGIRNLVKVRVGGGVVTLEPLEDPLRSLEKLVVKGTRDVEREMRGLRRAAEREAFKEVSATDSV
ncbi:TPA: AbrB/MazE/SpoVT family DNA-binding domain-containing protein [Candidatus Bathyarchaeota archaeon]|nr:AbrB/MazE/SpoVT family DNA-binding domain-containing protein [Candidatus Bathyarchaeota archaeon]